MRLLTGTRLGRYDIGARIGAGGMGEVYQARDGRLERDVAVKVLRKRLSSDPEVRARFEREARAAARLSHPNIVAIYDVGEQDGTSFVVMELLRGETLRDRLAKGPLTSDETRDTALHVVRALAVAHAHGVVHRDLKPENVFVTSTGAVKLLDFGIARLLDPESRESNETTTRLATKAGTTIGTVDYMSPEQVRGATVDHRSDLFSFGVVLYEMLNGHRPFTGESSADVAAAILTAEPQAVTRLSHDEAARLEAVARRCLRKRPDDRFASAEVVEEALATLAGAELATAVSRPTATGVVDTRRSVAVLPFVDLSLDKSLEFFCDGVAEEILNELSRVPGLQVTARSSAFQFRDRADDVRKIGQALNVSTVLEGSVRAAGRRLRINAQLVETTGGYQIWSERFDRELDDIFAVQDEIARAVVGALKVQPGSTTLTEVLGAGTVNLEAYTLYLKGRSHWNKRTEHDLAAARSFFEEAIARDPAYAEARSALAETYVTHALYGAAAPTNVMPLARNIAAEALALQPALPGALATDACISAVFDWNWDEAGAQFRRAIALCPWSSALHHWYAINCLVPQRRFAEARVELGLALATDPLSQTIVATLGLHAFFMQSYAVAETELRKAIAMQSDFPMAHLFLGLTCLQLGRVDEALSELRIAVELSPESAELVSALGYAHAVAGDEAGARQALATLTSRATERYVSPTLLAQIHCGLGAYDEALSSLELACQGRATDLVWTAVRSVWDPLREMPRFQAIQREMRLSD